MRPIRLLRRSAILGLATGGLLACAPTVKIEAPDKPIEINLNIRIEQEVRVKVERDLDKAIADDPALFGVPSTGVPKSGKTQGGKTP